MHNPERLLLESPAILVVGPESGTAGLVLGEVNANPGIFKSELCRRLGLGWGTVSHHVQRLQGRAAVVVELVAGRACVFPSAVPQEQRLRMVTHMRSEQVLAYLDSGPTTVPGLCARSGLTRRIVQRKMDELLRAGIVERYGHYRPLYRLKHPS